MNRLLNFNELTLENAGQWPLLVKIGVFLGTSFLIITLGYWFLVAENRAQYYKLQAQEVILKTNFANKQRQLYKLPDYRKQLQIMTERFVIMRKQFSVKNEMPGLLEEISKTGVSAGLKFESFAPQSEVFHDFYSELPFKISVVGTYFQLAIFLSRIAEMNRIVTLHELSIDRTSSKYKEVSEDELVMNITAKIYRYRIS